MNYEVETDEQRIALQAAVLLDVASRIVGEEAVRPLDAERTRVRRAGLKWIMDRTAEHLPHLSAEISQRALDDAQAPEVRKLLREVAAAPMRFVSRIPRTRE